MTGKCTAVFLAVFRFVGLEGSLRHALDGARRALHRLTRMQKLHPRLAEPSASPNCDQCKRALSAWPDRMNVTYGVPKFEGYHHTDDRGVQESIVTLTTSTSWHMHEICSCQ
ncbi:uncharacterized protein B0I36DRAFT_321294 [Microdochium trichocladiopsis]|uniref:Secreted protein n=1 Tax=Microdochium trichocladiopsis TaxID=1682393 RepID=A0A9P9BRW7_9PEZI|nr:uncharacterized protein B0I36DRAFT_321294 [Microdochium trichocladiopsis]KAH7033371.1 hypothetical protein B0I36DRAFT_321294 [Microdochium trichocladiopsis]